MNQANDTPVLFDHAALLERCGGDAELLQAVLGLFCEDFPGKLRALSAASDARALARAAHALAAALENVSAGAAAALARRIEDCAVRGELAEAQRLTPEFQTAAAHAHATIAREICAPYP